MLVGFDKYSMMRYLVALHSLMKVNSKLVRPGFSVLGSMHLTVLCSGNVIA